MILRKATIKYKGYDPDTLTKGSHKRVCCSCDNPNCKNPIRWVPYQAYRDLCKLCSYTDRVKLKISENNKDKKHTEKTKQKLSDLNQGENNPMWGKFGELNPNFGKFGKDASHWKGGLITKICEICGEKYEVNKSRSNSKFCSHKCKGKWMSKNLSGKNSPSYGKVGELSLSWQGGFDRKRPYVLPESQCRKMNIRFEGSEFHHLNKSIGIYIPKELHRHFYHNMKTGQGMDEMSLLSFQFIKGEFIND